MAFSESQGYGDSVHVESLVNGMNLICQLLPTRVTE